MSKRKPLASTPGQAVSRLTGGSRFSLLSAAMASPKQVHAARNRSPVDRLADQLIEELAKKAAEGELEEAEGG